MKAKFKVKTFIKTLIFLLILSAIIMVLIQVLINLKPVNSVKYRGLLFVFRDNVKAAERIPVYPNDKMLGNMFWDYKIQNISILFKPEQQYIGRYQANFFELAYKLTAIYKTSYPIIFEKNINASEIESFDNITREDGVLKIVYIPPTYANETIIKVSSNRIYVYAKTDRDMDLATMKIILSVMDYAGNYTYLN
ncbi:MAG: hypothetical protein QXM68_01380 [Candidatus Aenigmatarchaeota archaeon]|nr:hypothetical protein [Candidatus Aenigmarchaeota archaeon]